MQGRARARAAHSVALAGLSSPKAGGALPSAVPGSWPFGSVCPNRKGLSLREIVFCNYRKPSTHIPIILSCSQRGATLCHWALSPFLFRVLQRPGSNCHCGIMTVKQDTGHQPETSCKTGGPTTCFSPTGNATGKRPFPASNRGRGRSLLSTETF